VAWARVGTPDGGDGDIKTGINFYWTETFDGTFSHDASFYSWGLPAEDASFYSWGLPAEAQHMSDTNAPEEFLLFPEDVDLLPTQVQDGETDWTKIEIDDD
jgi:hypothetical protein